MRFNHLVQTGKVVAEEKLLLTDPTAYDSYVIPADKVLRLTTDEDTFTVTYIQVTMTSNSQYELCFQLEGDKENPYHCNVHNDLPIEIFTLT